MKKYQIIYADPPWFYNKRNLFGKDGKRNNFAWGATNHYSVMRTEDICKLPIKDISDRKSHVKNWKDIEYKNGQFFLNNKIIKRLHYGGGFCKNKMGYELFSENIVNKIKEITKCNF